MELLNVALSSETTPIQFKAPTSLANDFKKKYPRKGVRSKLLRGLVQMLLSGEIKNVSYKEKL